MHYKTQMMIMMMMMVVVVVLVVVGGVGGNCRTIQRTAVIKDVRNT